MTLRLLLIWTSLYIGQTWASQCLVIGDSQSALSLERLTQTNSMTGLIPGLERGLKSLGHQPVFYALKGSGAQDWITSPKENRNTLIGKENAQQHMTPFQRGGKTEIAFDTSGNKTFIDQIFDHHKLDNIDCFIIQLGDNDLFRQNAGHHMTELVKHILGKEKAPRLCTIVAPSFKEDKKRDEYPFITNQKKLNYITQVRHFLQKNNLLEDCPVVSSMVPKMAINLKTSGKKSFTYDGLFYNSHGGEVWAQHILQAQPFISR